MSEHLTVNPNDVIGAEPDPAEEGSGWRTVLVMLASVIAYGVLASGCVSSVGIDANEVPFTVVDVGVDAQAQAEPALALRC